MEDDRLFFSYLTTTNPFSTCKKPFILSLQHPFSTLDVDLAELDLRNERLDELTCLIPQDEPVKDQNTEDLSIEEQRMRELDAL